MEREKSSLILIDVQEKLLPFIDKADSLIKRCEWMLQIADELKVPVVITEQYPEGLGSTTASLSLKTSALSKTAFSCWQSAVCRQQLASLGRRSFVLIGIETHVCVLQTALDLLTEGYQVYVVVDAVSSRSSFDHNLGLQRMQQAGAQLVSSEMVFFEWLRDSKDPQFKAMSKQYLKGE